MSKSSAKDGDTSASQSTSNGSWNSVLRDIGMCAAAGGMGWGIRGQYGHETGAMIAGVLVGLAILLRFTPNVRSLSGVRCSDVCGCHRGRRFDDVWSNDWTDTGP